MTTTLTESQRAVLATVDYHGKAHLSRLTKPKIGHVSGLVARRLVEMGVLESPINVGYGEVVSRPRRLQIDLEEDQALAELDPVRHQRLNRPGERLETWLGFRVLHRAWPDDVWAVEAVEKMRGWREDGPMPLLVKRPLGGFWVERADGWQLGRVSYGTNSRAWWALVPRVEDHERMRKVGSFPTKYEAAAAVSAAWSKGERELPTVEDVPDD